MQSDLLSAKEAGPKFNFIDLFSGMGCFRLAAEELGGVCVFSSENDKYARKVYEANFNDTPNGDIKKIDETNVPSCDILLAGFPCQPFSKANRHGTDGMDRHKNGDLFFDIVRIARAVRPKAMILENVPNLARHNNGKTIELMINILKDAGYCANILIQSSLGFTPQNRKRLFIYCWDNNCPDNFIKPAPPEAKKLKEYLEPEVSDKYTLGEKTWAFLQDHTERCRQKGYGFSHVLFSGEERKTTTITARYYKDGKELLIKQKNNRPRRLTPREVARLMTIPDSFQLPVSNTQAYRLLGNGVVVDHARSIIKNALIMMKENDK